MYQRAGVKLHHRGVPNAPPEGFLLHDSDACFVQAYPAETAEAFCDGHNAAFTDTFSKLSSCC